MKHFPDRATRICKKNRQRIRRAFPVQYGQSPQQKSCGSLCCNDVVHAAIAGATHGKKRIVPAGNRMRDTGMKARMAVLS
jgi:hypothetical protein